MAELSKTLRDPNAGSDKGGSGGQNSDVWRDYTGETLANRYQLLGPLGRGGMGCVYRARHVVIGKKLAVKVLDRSQVSSENSYQRLFREAQTAASIGHQNIIEVADVGVTSHSDPYLVMEYLEGEDLDSFLRREGPLSLPTVLAIMEPVLLALSAAHSAGVVHRDLKPSNVFLVLRHDQPATVKLIDFGVAKLTGSTHFELTAPGAVVGTVGYMAPEQVRGSAYVDARTDLYSVGIIFFELFTGARPFDASGYYETLTRIVNDPLPTESLPQEVASIIVRATSKSPDERYETAAELLSELKGLHAWPERHAALVDLGGRIVVAPSARDLKVSEPASPLGAEISPEAMASLVPTGERPADLMSTMREAPWEVEPPPTKSRTMLFMGVGVAAMALIGTSVWLTRAPDEDLASATSATPPAPAAADVQITVEGAPAGAKIFVDGAPVTQNPFRLAMSTNEAMIRIEHAGYAPFLVEVVPSADLVVPVAMRSRTKPAASAAPAPSAAKPAGAAPAPKAAPAVRQPAQGGVKKGGRDTLYTEEFR